MLAAPSEAGDSFSFEWQGGGEDRLLCPGLGLRGWKDTCAGAALVDTAADAAGGVLPTAENLLCPVLTTDLFITESRGGLQQR